MFQLPRILFVLLFMTIMHTGALAQKVKVNVSGTVTDQKGAPLQSVTVNVKGSNIAVTTNGEGRFTVNNVDDNAMLTFSYVGFQSQEVAVNNRTTINVTLSEGSKTLNDVVVVGYGTQKRANLTGSVASVDFADLVNLPQSNTVNILSGRLPGVSVIQGGGQPGADQADVNIRGLGTLNDATPLVIIDGVQATLSDFGNLSPQDISNVSVLKDASSAAIYGSRGANGVILVTTKVPNKERININFNAYTALQKATYLPQFVESWQFLEFQYYAPAVRRYGLEVIDSARNGIYSDDIANTNWYDEIFKTSPMSQYNISVSGRTKGTSFQLSGGVFNQEGILRGTDADRYTLRGNVQSQVTDRIKVGLNIWGYSRNSHQPYRSIATILRDAGKVPNMPVRYANGQFAVYNAYVTGDRTVENPLLNTMIGHDNMEEFKVNAQPTIEIKLLKGLDFRTAYTYSYSNIAREEFNPTFSYNNNLGNPAKVNKVSLLSEASTGIRQNQWNSTLNYAAKFGDNHSFSALLGHEIVDYSQKYFRAEGNNLPSNDLQVLDNATSSFLVNGNKQKWSLQSFFGRANYAYKDKYLIEGNLRSDGSSRFNGSYKLSPSGSVGWVVSEEKFMEDLNPAISFLKFRAGYGKLGNDRIGNYTYQQSLDLGGYYTVGDVTQTAAAITNFGNPNIDWEQTTSTNLGMDLGMIKNRLFINFDIYKRVTDGILFSLPLPLSFGTAISPFQNIAQVSNKGVELNIEYKNTAGKVSYRVSGNVSYNKNNVDKLNGQRVVIGNQAQGGLNLIEENQPISSWFGYVQDGLFTQVDIDNKYPKVSSDDQVGSLKFKDINNDGVINDQDRTIIGNGDTPYSFGLNGGLSYSGFDFSFLFQGIAGKDIYTWDFGNRAGNGAQNNFWKEWWDHSYDPVRNPGGDWPIVRTQGTAQVLSSSFWVKNASYLRLKNVELGYSLPKSSLSKFKISDMRFYLSGQNLLAISNISKNLDPERANFQQGNASYPQTTVFSFGINTTF